RGLLRLAKAQPLPFAPPGSPYGKLSCPSPLPYPPHCVMKLPSLSNFSIRWFPVSVTYTSPAASRAIPQGERNCPASCDNGLLAWPASVLPPHFVSSWGSTFVLVSNF